MAKKTKKPALSQAQKSGLKVLRKKGVYKPKAPRAAPTRYAKSLLGKFADLLTGKASIVTASQKGRKGFGAARKFKREKEAVGTLRVVRNKIIVPTQAGEVARFSKKKGTVRVTRKLGKDFYVREPFAKPIYSLKDLKSQLKPGDRVAVPLYRGHRGVEWRTLTYDDFAAFWREYGPSTTGKEYEDLGEHIQAFHIEGVSAEILPKEPVDKKPAKKPAKKKRRLV